MTPEDYDPIDPDLGLCPICGVELAQVQDEPPAWGCNNRHLFMLAKAVLA